MNQSDFFDLLQVAIDSKSTFPHALSEEAWTSMFDVCAKQGLLGIGFVGCCKLPKEMQPPKSLLLQWAGQMPFIEDTNRRLSLLCSKITQKLSQVGFNSCVLKGQSNLINYPDNLRLYRTPGDIDLWVLPKSKIEVVKKKGEEKTSAVYEGKKAVIEYFRERCRRKHPPKEPEIQYHHIDWSYQGVEVEVHFRLSWLNNPFANRRLQQWSKNNEQWGKREYEGFPIPTASFNVIYQLVHINRHLFNEGIGLRQLLDYYFVLKAYHEEKSPQDKNDILSTLSQLNLKRFAGAVMYVLKSVFNIADELLLCPPDQKDGAFLLEEIMQAGNFGQFDSRNTIKPDENFFSRFVRRQTRAFRFLTRYPSEVLWGPCFSISQRVYRWVHGYR